MFASTSRWVHRASLTGFPVQVVQFSQKQQLLLHRIHSLLWLDRGLEGRKSFSTSIFREGETHSFNVGPIMHIVLFV